MQTRYPRPYPDTRALEGVDPRLDARYRLRMEAPREDDTQTVERRSLPPLPTLQGGPFLVDVANRDELFRIFDEEDETLRPYFTSEDPLR